GDPAFFVEGVAGLAGSRDGVRAGRGLELGRGAAVLRGCDLFRGEGEVEATRGRGVERDARSDRRRGAEDARALDLVEDDELAASRGDEEEGLVQLARRLFEWTARGGDDRVAIEEAVAEGDEPEARLVAAVERPLGEA